ncbi:peptidoglycan-binding protein [Enterobacter bugandensis]
MLYSVWGYEVSRSEAWCDQAYRAGMTCLSGKESLASLMAQSLPWIATLNVDNASIPVVIIGEGEGTLAALSAGKTWILNKAWFSKVWTGSYTLMWKPSPDGNASITKKSSIDDIAWLDTMLSRVLNVEAENTGEWSPMLTEKIRQFQTQNKIKADGVMGKVTLIRLWQVLGESPKLVHEGGKV